MMFDMVVKAMARGVWLTGVLTKAIVATDLRETGY
jgi:hypothetical protein